MPQQAEFVIAKFGGQSALARLVGKGQSTVQHWAKSGQIPAQWQSKLLEVARERGIALKPADFMSPAEGGHSHAVQFYNDDAFLVESVSRFMADALNAGSAGVVIATAAHREKLAEGLRLRGFDVATLLRSGRYTALDASATLKLFMREGQPQPKRFFSAIKKVVERARRTSEGRRISPAGKPALFGEMVAVLWRQGERQAAIALEKLWNELAAQCEFSLLCGYPMNGFLRPDLGQSFAEVCNQHADVIPAETYSGVADEDARRRAVAGLQQRVQAMDGELRRSRE